MYRRYEGRWNRFSQPDPFDGSYSLSDPQSFNRYAYVENDPVNLIDPTGLDGTHEEDPNHNPHCPSGQAVLDGQCVPGGTVTVDGGGPEVEDFPTIPGFGHTTFLPMMPIPHEEPGRVGPVINLNHPQGGQDDQQRERQRQQQGFDDCARSKIRTFRRAEYKAIGKIAVGTVLTTAAGEIGVEARAANTAAQVGVRSAGARIIGFTARYRVGQVLAAGNQILGAFTGALAYNGFMDSLSNNAAVDKAIEDCKGQFPMADHTTLRLFLTTY